MKAHSQFVVASLLSGLLAACGDGEVYFPKEVGDRLKRTMDGLPEAEKRLEKIEAKGVVAQKQENFARTIQFCREISIEAKAPLAYRLQDSHLLVETDFVDAAELAEVLSDLNEQQREIRSASVVAKCFKVNEGETVHLKGVSLDVVSEHIQIFGTLSTTAEDKVDETPSASGDLSLKALLLETNLEGALSTSGAKQTITQIPSPPSMPSHQWAALKEQVRKDLVSVEANAGAYRYLRADDAADFCALVSPYLNLPNHEIEIGIRMLANRGVDITDANCVELVRRGLKSYKPENREREIENPRGVFQRRQTGRNHIQDFFEGNQFSPAFFFRSIFGAVIKVRSAREFLAPSKQRISTYPMTTIYADLPPRAMPGQLNLHTYFSAPDLKLMNDFGPILDEVEPTARIQFEYAAPDMELILQQRRQVDLVIRMNGSWYYLTTGDQVRGEKKITLKPTPSPAAPRAVNLGASPSPAPVLARRLRIDRKTTAQELSVAVTAHDKHQAFQDFIQRYEAIAEKDPSGQGL